MTAVKGAFQLPVTLLSADNVRMAPTNTDEKHGAALANEQRIENVNAEKISTSSGELEAQRVELDEAEAQRVLRKVDYRLVPMLSLLYLVAFIDRSNSKPAHFQIRLGIC